MSDEALKDATDSEMLAEPAETGDEAEDQSLAQTEVHLSNADLQEALSRAEATGGGSVSTEDFSLLKQELLRSVVDNNRLQGKVDDLTLRLESLRSEFSLQSAETQEELETHRTVLDRSAESTRDLLAQLAEAHTDNKTLKAQNLQLQYHLNQWGLPAEVDEPGVEGHLDFEQSGSKSFFPPLVAPEGTDDPVPFVLKGNLNAFYFPDLIHFLSNAKLLGVLTVVADGIVSKLYVDRGILRLASWNNRDRSVSLAALLKQSELVPTEALEQLEQLPLFDLEVASILTRQQLVEPGDLRGGLKEHARVILSFLFELKRGSFFFQPGSIEELEALQFKLSVIDLLLHTAAEVDERTREGEDEAPAEGSPSRPVFP